MDWRMPIGREWPILLGIGISTQIAQLYMTRGLQLERSARATTTGTLQIVFAGILGAVVLGEHPDAWSIAGALVIVGSTLVLARVHRTGGPPVQ